MPAFGGYVDDLYRAASRVTKKGRAAGKVVSGAKAAIKAAEGLNPSAPVGMRGSASVRLAAQRARAALPAAEKQMIKSGRRAVITGVGAGAGTMMMSNNRKSGIGSYRPPMPQTRGPIGSGRFA